LRDSVWVNEWPGKQKTVYTVFSLKPEGFQGVLFEIPEHADKHYIDLWNHEPILVTKQDQKSYTQVQLEGFNAFELGTNNEGSVSCIAELPQLISAKIMNNRLVGRCPQGDKLRIWAGNPAYGKVNKEVSLQGQNAFDFFIPDLLGRYEGKVVVQAFDQDELLDEVILYIKPGTPRLISESIPTAKFGSPNGMVRIPAGTFTFSSTHGDAFVPYPKEQEGKVFNMKAFWMDKHPITNEEFHAF